MTEPMFDEPVGTPRERNEPQPRNDDQKRPRRKRSGPDDERGVSQDEDHTGRRTRPKPHEDGVPN